MVFIWFPCHIICYHGQFQATELMSLNTGRERAVYNWHSISGAGVSQHHQLLPLLASVNNNNKKSSLIGSALDEHLGNTSIDFKHSHTTGWIKLIFFFALPYLWFSKWGPQACSISITWELVTNANSGPHSKLTESESGWWCRVGGSQAHCFNEPPGDSVPHIELSLPLQPCEGKVIKVEETTKRNSRLILRGKKQWSGEWGGC